MKQNGWKFVTAVLCFLAIAVIAVILSEKAEACPRWNVERNMELLTHGRTYAELEAEIATDTNAGGKSVDESVDEPTEEMELLGTWRITGYDPYCEHCCSSTDGITASGVEATCGYTVAAKGLPFGTKLYIDGFGYFEVQDRGVGENWVDIACENHDACYAITGWRNVWLVK